MTEERLLSAPSTMKHGTDPSDSPGLYKNVSLGVVKCMNGREYKLI
jgi:hypothetical protein